ncbi:cyclic nucleotide-binding protein [Gammaproteobacteria bacterium 42_54_T18]|nr:cyclic nucleotide-binding protein [Gammaproteobacteria bacterium 42_54_T18]
MQDFVSYFTGPSGSLEATDFDQYELSPQLKHYKKGQLLISQGQLAPKLFFLVKGFARYMSISPEGKEFTQSFACAPSVAGSTRAMTRKTPALFSIEALDDVLCLEFEWSVFFTKMEPQRGFLTAYNCLLENMFIKKEEREYAFVQHSAEQRYLDFLESNPQLRDKLPLKMIASHIGITPIALSRIRKKLK